MLAIAKLKPLSLFIFILLMLKKALDNVKIEKWKVKVVLALQWLASPLSWKNTKRKKVASFLVSMLLRVWFVLPN